MDKVLALRGGSELVSLWAQLSSVIELVSAVALSGVGVGLSVLVAQAGAPERQAQLSWRALALGLGICLPVALAATVAGGLFPGTLSSWTLALAALCGWIGVIHGTVAAYWTGLQRRDLLLALTVAGALAALAVTVAAPREVLLEALALSQALPAVVILLLPRPAGTLLGPRERALERYILPGVAIGVLSPASTFAARAFVADAMSWHEAGELQALWRVSDWICGFASGVLWVLYLPRLAAAGPGAPLRDVMASAINVVLLPSVLLFIVLFAFHRPMLALLYDPSFQPSATAAALIFAGSVVRIISWLPLVALYATHRTRAIAIGEFLSVPLFAVLAGAMGSRLTLELAGVFWVLSYACYALFNAWALRR